MMKLVLLCAVALSVFFAGPARGQEQKVFFPSYAGPALEAVRQWEAQWAGKIITSQNVDALKDYLPESLHAIMKAPAVWGELWFTIVAYRQVPLAPGYAEASRKHYGQAQTGKQGELQNYSAGLPFPAAAMGLQMAHNFRQHFYGDDTQNHETGFIVDGRLKYDMELEFVDKLSYFSGRTDHQPVPEFPGNKAGVWRALTSTRLKPGEERNQIILQLIYQDPTKIYDCWLWNPTIRRVVRNAAQEREDTSGGKDYCRYDAMGWDGPMHINTYKYLGSRDMLFGRHTDTKKLEHNAGTCLWNGAQRERVKAHIVEATSRDPNFVYTKMVWFLDPETWELLYTERYDKSGKLWRALEQMCFVGADAAGVPVSFNAASQMMDLQRVHSCLIASQPQFGMNYKPALFTVNNLQKHGY